MNTNPVSIIDKTIASTIKFDSLTVVENGLVLKCQNKREIEIPCTKLEKVFIKK